MSATYTAVLGMNCMSYTELHLLNLQLQTFIIPPLVYNIHYQLKANAAQNRAESTKPPSK